MSNDASLDVIFISNRHYSTPLSMICGCKRSNVSYSIVRIQAVFVPQISIIYRPMLTIYTRLSLTTDFIEERLAIIRKLKRIDIEDFINFRSSSVYVTASSNLSLLEERHVPNFRWGLMSSGVSMGEVSTVLKEQLL